MKVLHVITSLRTGGAEKLMVDLLPRLKKNGVDVELLLFDGISTGFRKHIENEGIKVYDLGIGGSVYSPMKLFKLLKYIKNYDVIHTHNTACQFFVPIAKLLSITKPSLITTEHNTFNRRRGKIWIKPLDKWMYNKYKKVICISKKAEENLKCHIKKTKADIITINNGIDVKKYSTAYPSTELEQIAPNSKKITMVAGFRPQKDQDTLIKSINYLPEYFHLFLIGDGERRNQLEELIRKERLSDRVHLLGIKEDVPSLLKASDYIVMSSHYEGLSLSSLEGMSVGKPFIASDVDGLREVVMDAGILFPHGNYKDLANEIISLEKDREKHINIASHCGLRSREFDINIMADKYIELYF